MKSYQIGRDVILRCHIANVRISGIFASRIIRDVSERWNMRVDSMPSQLWGQYMAGTAMLGSFCKGEERIRLTLRSSDVSDLYVEAMALGEVRGSILADKSAAVYEVPASMQLDKILYGAKTPYTTYTKVTGNAAEDFQSFYDRSEQIPTKVAITSDGMNCCGITIQELPDDRAKEIDVQQLTLQPPCSSLKAPKGFVAYVNTLLDYEAVQENQIRRIPLDYYCRCSRSKFATRLVQLPTQSIWDLWKTLPKGDNLCLTCQFCNERYYFSRQQIEELLAEK
ncbi:unnamed protein product [Albugo candida]|uniref:Uncharacterized protein n=1 Tax=Albugo candida TaxID=65357 RepID=A0A024GG44_9STRA|nr:unnamed protein product [Albugo candida]|eukprot:CCI45478.1 unnamed protein product [Albugo candida]